MSHDPILFDHAIAPLTREQFLAEHWNKSFLHLAGAPGRFAALLPWEELNDILAWHGPVPPQLKLFQDGKGVEYSRYSAGQQGALRLDSAGLIASLSQGATMVLDAVDKLAPRIARLAADFQEILHARTDVNLYAGWRKQKGFDLHWDYQDVIVLQLSGRKHWKVYAPTRLHPLREDVEAPPRPTGEPVWDGILEDGAMIYLPRGWWHVAFPLDEPSLHISVSVTPPNGVDFLHWWIPRVLLRHPEIRRNLPHDGNSAARRDYLAGLLKLMEEGLAGDPLGEFLAERSAGIRTWPHFHLPSAPGEQGAPLTMATRIRLGNVRSLLVERDEEPGKCKFRVGKEYWVIPAELAPAFEKLSGQISETLANLSAGIPSEMIPKLVIVMDRLAAAGVVFKEDPATA